jgi:hypothetical protein
VAIVAMANVGNVDVECLKQNLTILGGVHVEITTTIMAKTIYRYSKLPIKAEIALFS